MGVHRGTCFPDEKVATWGKSTKLLAQSRILEFGNTGENQYLWNCAKGWE